MKPSVAVLGAGVMGETLLAAVLQTYPASQVVITEKRPERAAELTAKYQVAVVSNTEAAAAEVLILAVKPQDLPALLTEISPILRPGQLLISLAAGRTIAFLENLVPAGVSVARVMPNTPAQVQAGMSAISPSATCTPEQLELAMQLLAPTGAVVQVPESQQNAVTAVSGSGPAYFFLMIEAITEAGVAQGLSADLAAQLATQTMFGAAKLLLATGADAAELRRMVTSPGGTTAQAIATFEDGNFRALVQQAMQACADRAAELAGE